MSSVSRKAVGLSVASILDRLQHSPAHVQIVATAMVFWRLCKQLGVREQQALEVVNNLFSDGMQPASEFRATDLYIKHQLGGRA